MEESTEPHGGSNAPEDTPPSTGYVWHALIVVGTIAMLLMVFSLWRRVRQINPVERCAHAYWSSYTAVDTGLVDAMKVRSPDGNGHTTCEVLRKNGAVNTVPRTEIQQKRMP
jgi:hypothetical protein